MAIMEVVLVQRYYNQTVLNRFHYIASGTPAAVTLSYGLLHAMALLPSRLSNGSFPNGVFMNKVQAIQVADVTTISANARDLYSVTDFYESPFPTPPTGGNGGQGQSPAVAYGFSQSRVRTDIRRGMKRFVGVSESSVDGGGVIASGTLGIMSDLADLMGDTLTYDDEGNTLTYAPCILGYEEYTTPSGKKAYRKYATASAQLAHVAQGGIWSPYTTTRTQTSRQYGRGV